MANFSNAFSKVGSFASESGYKTGVKLAPELMVANIIQTVLQFLGVLFLCFIIYSGFIWMTANGATEKVKKAKTIILNTIIGLIIVVLAYAISEFVIQNILQGQIRNI